MKACEALIAWTPKRWGDFKRKTVGQVQIGHLLQKDDSDWTHPYAFTGGAAYAKTRNMKGDDALAQLFVDFHTIVVRDGIDPVIAHDAFMVIDEYRKAISQDTEGFLKGVTRP